VRALDGILLRYSEQKNFTAHGRKGAKSDCVKRRSDGGFVKPRATEKKEMDRARYGLAYGAGDTEHGIVLVSISGVYAEKQSPDE
jgi:hypothetical protein